MDPARPRVRRSLDLEDPAIQSLFADARRLDLEAAESTSNRWSRCISLLITKI